MVDLKTSPVAGGRRPDIVSTDASANEVVAETKTPVTDEKTTKALHAPVKVKNIDAPELKYQKISKLEDIEALSISETAKKNLTWLLKKHGIESADHSSAEFFSVQVNEEGKAVLDMGGKRASEQLFKNNFLYKITGWFTRLFSRVHWGIGAKMLKAGSGMNVADPTNKEAKLEDSAKILEGLKTNRYSVSAIYDLNSDKYKEPEAIALYDQFGELLEQMKANLPKDLPEEAKQSAIDEINKYESQGIDGVCVCNTVLFRDDIKEKYTGTEAQSAGERQRLLAQFAVTNSDKTTLILPSNIFTADFANAEGHIFEKVKNLKTIEMTDKGPKEVNVATAEVVRNIALKDKPISAEAFAKVFTLHNLTELISSPKQMTPELMGMLADIDKNNKDAIDEFNDKVNPKTEAKETKAETKKEVEADGGH